MTSQLFYGPILHNSENKAISYKLILANDLQKVSIISVRKLW